LLTDSGGLQEEAPALGLRTLILRTVTERPEVIAAGAAELVGLTANAIVTAVRANLRKPSLRPLFPFGDGQAAARIAGCIDQWLGMDTDWSGHREYVRSRLTGHTITP
ncbi:MAG: UDP-N-acetylglucosamine 2-epimerase, partial [Sphingomonadaceae bacterium]